MWSYCFTGSCGASGRVHGLVVPVEPILTGTETGKLEGKQNSPIVKKIETYIFDIAFSYLAESCFNFHSICHENQTSTN